MPTMEAGGGLSERCSQCGTPGGPLLACDEELNHQYHKHGGPKPRFCNNCMIGKKVKVFWPVDESWYTGIVQEFDASTGEHQLQYPDGDHEWVKIGDIINASMGAGGSANNSTIATADSHDPMGHMPMGGHHPPRQALPNHPGSEPTRPEPEASPPQDYRGGASAQAPPPYNYGHYPPPPPGSGGAQYPGPGGPNMGPPPPYGPPGTQQQNAPPPHYQHPNMPPPPYGMYPGYMFPPPHMGGSPYGMPGYYPAPPGPIGADPARGDDQNSINNAMGGGSSVSNSDIGGGGGASRSRKSGPKPWTKEEDSLLLNLVHTMQWPMKWTIVAQSLPDRTGKQCRERYVNHLNPRLKVSDWNSVEDSTIFHLYNTIGSHWAKMSKIIPGRTDNGIKNRFHNIRRQYEREDSHRLRLSAAEDFPDEVRLDRLRKFPDHLEGRSTQLWDMKSAIGVLAAQSVLGGNSNSAHRAGGGSTISRFGPFRQAKVDEVELCVRCGLIVPSIHTGTDVCTKTGWCQSCARIPPNVSSNLLRETLNLRREQDNDLREIIEGFEDLFIPDAENAWPYKKLAGKGLLKVEGEKGKDGNEEKHEDAPEKEVKA